MAASLIVLFFIFFPTTLILLSNRSALIGKIGPVVLAFTSGILLAFLVDGLSLDIPFLAKDQLEAIQKNVSEISIVLALPLILFSINIKKVLKTTPSILLSMALAILSVIVMCFLGVFLFGNNLTNIEQVAGMATGAYTGGGPNMGAIKTAIHADNDLFLTMVAYDILFSAIYLLFLITISKRVFGWFLKKYKPINLQAQEEKNTLSDDSSKIYGSIIKTKTLPKTLLALLLAILIVGTSVGISELFSEESKSLVVIIGISTLGILASFLRFVRELPNSFPLGMYLILIFCFTSGSMTNLEIFTQLNLYLAGFFMLVIFGSMVLQGILSRLFGIDLDTFLITSAAAILSVPFIPITAASLKNKEILFGGFSAAILGYLLANYLGIIIHYVAS